MEKFIFTNDHKTEFNGYVSDLYGNDVDKAVKEAVKLRNQALRDGDEATAAIKQAEINSLVDDKNNTVSTLTEAYFAHAGEMPDYRQLDRLSTWILRWIEHDDPECYVLTDRQMATRNREREALFYNVESYDFSMERDGNRIVQPKPHMDAHNPSAHRVKVRLGSDELMDKRMYNGPLKKYNELDV